MFIVMLISGVTAQDRDADSTFMRIAFPADSETVYINQVRFGAWVADTLATVFVQGEERMVYSSGAVVGMLNIMPGWNEISFRAVSDTVTHEQTLRLFRTPPAVTLPASPTRIAPGSISPQVNQTFFGTGEIVVRFRGSPGGRAKFRIKGLTPGKIPMAELPPGEAGGLRGIYEGVYLIRPDDTVDRKKVKVWLKGSKGLGRSARSNGRVTVRQPVQPVLLRSAGASTLIYNWPGGEIIMDLPEGILMAARAKRGRWWELTLSTGQYGYASNGDVAQGPKGRTLPKAALRGLTITEDSSWTTLAFATSAKVPYRISQHADPQRLSLVLHRTHMADEWTRYPTSDSLIDHFAWEQVGPELLRFDIFLNIGQQWGYRAKYVGNQLHLGIRKPPVIGKDALFENLTIVLDPGHGGEHQGSLGATGMREKDVNLDYALMLYEMLENRGANVHLTRTADTTLSLSRRMEMARELDAHLFIWLHNNAVGSARPPLEVQGASSFYTQLQALPFVRGAYPHLLALDLVPQGMVHRSYYITRQTDMVVYLVEGAFLSHPEDEMFLQKDENLKRLAEAVLKGLEDTLRELAE